MVEGINEFSVEKIFIDKKKWIWINLKAKKNRD